jgi:hypothetical protein
MSEASAENDARVLRLTQRWQTPCMANLEALSWIDAFAVTGYGARVGVRVSDPALIPMLQARLPPGARITRMGAVERIVSVILGGPGPRRGARTFHLVYDNHTLAKRSHDLAAALAGYDSALRQALALLSRRKVFMHAGAVGWRGRAILLPAPTFCGKTSLTAALVKAGADYLSDEYAVLDADGLVHPFPKPLSVRDARARQTDLPLAALGGRVAKRPLPAGLVVMTRYKEGVRWRPRRLTPSLGVLEMMSNTFVAFRRPELALGVLSTVARQAAMVKSSRPDADETAAAILALADRTSGWTC